MQFKGSRRGDLKWCRNARGRGFVRAWQRQAAGTVARKNLQPGRPRAMLVITYAYSCFPEYLVISASLRTASLSRIMAEHW